MTEHSPVISAPPLSERNNKFQEMARASWLAPLIAIVINFLLMASQGAISGPTNKVQIVVGPLLIFGGLLFGAIALFGVKKYGRQKILIPALIGVGINLLLIVMAALPFLLLPRRAKLQPAVHLPSSQVIKNERLGFNIDVPEGFRNFPEAKTTPVMEHVFIKGVHGKGEPLLVINIERLKGLLPRNKPLKREHLPAGFVGQIVSRDWRGLQVDTTIAPVELNGAKMVVFTIQIPLKPSAIQISVGGPESKRAEIEQISATMLASLEGETNW